MRIVKRSALERNTAIYGSPRKRCSTVFERRRAECNVVRTTLDGRVNPTTFTTALSTERSFLSSFLFLVLFACTPTRFSHANERLSRFSTVTRERRRHRLITSNDAENVALPDRSIDRSIIRRQFQRSLRRRSRQRETIFANYWSRTTQSAVVSFARLNQLQGIGEHIFLFRPAKTKRRAVESVGG